VLVGPDLLCLRRSIPAARTACCRRASGAAIRVCPVGSRAWLPAVEALEADAHG